MNKKLAKVMQAEDAFKKGDWIKSRSLYLIDIQESSTLNQKSIKRLAQISEKLFDYCSARDYYKQLIDVFGAKPELLFRKAECERHLKLWDQAKSSYVAVLQHTPDHTMSRFRLSQCYSFLNMHDSALTEITKVIDTNSHSRFLAHKAWVYKRLSCLKEAIAFYEKAIASSDDKISVSWFIRLGECYLQCNMMDKATANLQHAVQLNPDNGSLQSMLAFVHTKTGQTTLAVEAYQQAVALDNTHAEWFAELGRLLADSDKAAAIAAYQRAVDLGRKALSYEIAVLACDGQSLQHVAPETLFTAKRFDLCSKLLYARSLLGLPSSNSSIDPTELYLRHIHLRTKGKEPDNLTKTSLADYQHSFAQLLESMQQHGFDESHAIPLAQDGGLLNGAHRGAAATALRLAQIPVVFMDRPQGIGWDFNWFLQRGFNLDELNELLLCWLQSTPERGHIVILWPAVVEHWDSMTAEIANELELVTQRDLTFTALGFSELVKDIYSTDKVAELMPNILAKVDKLAAYPPKLRVLVVYGDSRRVHALKVKTRQQYDAIVPEQLFCTLHASADHAEALHLGHILFHQPTLTLLQNRTRPLSAHLCNWIAEAKQALVNRGASVQDGCVVGGAVLDAYEVRQADDLDMTVSSTVRQAHFSDKACPLTDTIDIVNKDYARSVSGVICDDNLLVDRALHLYVRGFKFASLNVVRQRKSYSQREKDLVDLAKISRYLWLAKHG
ncbi:tetratricopeptide repeat protein [Vibrio metschnikovii]|uniref:tetratricopeptide repeat protein n=1 Tax=Vibrio metschnikovii TaxID=28172 RepID=UPI00315D4323